MDYQKLILGIILVIILYVVISYILRDNTQTKLFDVMDASSIRTFSSNNYSSSSSNNYSISLWYYLSDFNHRYNQEKEIFKLSTSGESGTVFMNATFAPTKNDLMVDVMTQNGSFEKVAIENVPLQRWTHILIVVNNRAVDLYLDGKLVKTKVLTNVPKVPTAADIVFGGGSDTQQSGFKGYLSNFRYYSISVNPKKAYDIYKEGYSDESVVSSMLGGYKMKVSFMKNNRELNSVSI